MKSMRLKTKLSAVNALIVFLTVALISLGANFFIEQQFKRYIANQQEQKTQDIVLRLAQQYDPQSQQWKPDMVHAIGMSALYEGYILKVYDESGGVLWAAESCDMNTCMQVMGDITARMKAQYPHEGGQFASKAFPLTSHGSEVGIADISFYGPYFLNENDIFFLNALNIVLLTVGVMSLALSILIGSLLAIKLSRPIQKTAQAVGLIAGGKYGTRMEGSTGTRELDELTLSVNHLAQSIEAQDLLRKQLTADVAHELRTPLTTLQTHTEAMLLGVWQPSPERLQSNVEEIVRIQKIVTDLENLASAENGALPLHLTPVALLDLVKSALRSFEAEIEQKNLHVEITGHCADVMLDWDRMSQVVINLLSNAMKYTPKNGNITIALAEEKDLVRIFVQDTGEGIPPQAIPYIFERFYRADASRNRLTGGSGIGLAIVKSIVEAHGGTVTVQSVAGQGSRFVVSLPKERPSVV